ncbi:GGDEF domain-containing protein [Marinobacter sp. F3R08]|uniref:GGDEF domain-containing protein n=1 Tax=Marinobacter sp. F3R08 TaxID=2841559 RepID=UPI001C09B156|nr:sensor domain-containing diguanylate cyclase [Marinobacter sp. F3R08]MBU2953689.1 sensor domain-containing diguanylate cyclase [Marinobacter sp. F3R08]
MPVENSANLLNASSSRLLPFINALPDAVVIVDNEHRIVLVNAHAGEMFGHPAEILEGSDLAMIIPQLYQASHRERVNAYFKNPIPRPMGAHKRFYGVRADGSEIPVDIMINTIILDGALVAMALVRDVTYQRALEDRLIRESLTDEMTGFFNRKHFINQLNAQHSGFRRSGLPSSVIMFDFDHFKRINDQYGHPAGDIALIETAEMIRNELRPLDVACRIGGEEFAIILPNTQLQSATIFAERIRQKIEDMKFSFEGITFQATVTMSVASFLASDESYDSLIKRADKALYIGKAAGRNCVATQEALEQPREQPSTNRPHQ